MMERIKTLLANLLLGVALLTALGFGLMAAGVALVLGAVMALALQLAGPRRAKDIRGDETAAEHADAHGGQHAPA